MANSSTATLTTEAKETITSRLSCIEDLYFPRKVQQPSNTPSSRKTLLLNLITSDPVIFLERYGSHLTLPELNHFTPLNSDYEVNWHINHLRSLINPTEEEIRANKTTIRNRRLAYMDNPVLCGGYFSEESMREREPYLHHEFIGKYQDLSGRCMARPGEKWSDTLIRRAEEAVLVEKIRGEQIRLGVDEKEWVGGVSRDEEEEEEMEEVESESEEEEETKPEDINEEEEGNNMEERMEMFVSVMKERFLAGEDGEHLDYTKIDGDESLDDHWIKEVDRDAEEKYFDDV